MTDLPAEITAEVERLTRLARRASDDREATAYHERRDALLDEYGFTVRLREDDHGETLVCHPQKWIEDGVADLDEIEDVDRAAEIPLDGPGDPDEWEELYDRNMAVAREVRTRHGEDHGANAEALAEFVSNHYAKPIASVTAGELAEFRDDYYLRNVWPTERQADVLDRSLELTFEVLELPAPELDLDE